MKILMVSARYLPHRGGLENVVYHLAQQYTEKGHHVEIITNRYPRNLPEKEEIDGVNVTRMMFLLPQTKYLKKFRFDLWLAGYWYRLHTARKLIRYIQKFEPDIVHNQYLNEAAEFTGNALKSFSKQIPWIITFQGGDVDGEPISDKSNLIRFHNFTQQANRITACSVFLAKQAERLLPDLVGDIEIIYNGVNVKQFADVQQSSILPPYVFAVGQVVPHKGFELLINAFLPLISKHRDVELWIAGDGSQRDQLEELAGKNPMSKRIRFLGKVDEKKVASLMAGSLFVAVPSLREPFGIVVLEGMAVGKPVLASRVGGIPEFLPVPPNRLVEPDRSAWESALDAWITLSMNGQLIAKENAEAVKKFDWSIIGQKYLDIYSQEKINV